MPNQNIAELFIDIGFNRRRECPIPQLRRQNCHPSPFCQFAETNSRSAPMQRLPSVIEENVIVIYFLGDRLQCLQRFLPKRSDTQDLPLFLSPGHKTSVAEI